MQLRSAWHIAAQRGSARLGSSRRDPVSSVQLVQLGASARPGAAQLSAAQIELNERGSAQLKRSSSAAQAQRSAAHRSPAQLSAPQRGSAQLNEFNARSSAQLNELSAAQANLKRGKAQFNRSSSEKRLKGKINDLKRSPSAAKAQPKRS